MNDDDKECLEECVSLISSSLILLLSIWLKMAKESQMMEDNQEAVMVSSIIMLVKMASLVGSMENMS